jgi:hypothetical protein
MNWKGGAKGVLLLVVVWMIVIWRHKLLVNEGSTGGWINLHLPTLSPSRGGGPLPMHPTHLTSAPKSNRGSIPAPTPQHYPLRAIVIGDWGTGLDTSSGHNQKGVAARLATVSQTFTPALVISTGDQMYNAGVESVTDEAFNDKFEAVYTSPELQASSVCASASTSASASAPIEARHLGSTQL